MIFFLGVYLIVTFYLLGDAVWAAYTFEKELRRIEAARLRRLAERGEHLRLVHDADREDVS